MNLNGILTERKQTGVVYLEERLPAEHITVEEGAIEEEQAAPIQTVQEQQQQTNRSEALTPQRKISTSSRFINAFQQFYSTATNSSNSASTTVLVESTNEQQAAAAAAAAVVTATTETTMPAVYSRTPSKNMESKLLSMWHNVKYGWGGKMRVNFSKEQPVWLLGRCYHRKYTPNSSMESSAEFSDNLLNQSTANNQANTTETTTTTTTTTTVTNPTVLPQVEEIVVPQEMAMDATENQLSDNPWEEGIDGFRRDFYSRIWLTYRREFPIMNGSNYTSDCGWGCMLRSGQMLLAQALVCHFLGRTWRYDADTQLHSTYDDNMHKKIIKWFGDSSSKGTPFSIHALVSLGEQLGKKPGDWYGPASVSYLLKHALKNAAQENADFDNITIYVAKNCTIYMQEIEESCAVTTPPAAKPIVPWQTPRSTPSERAANNKTKKSNWKSLIVLVPLRLGTEKLNPVYAHCLKLLLSTEYCIGIIGGRPKHSLYFVGFQEDKLIHLDPHYCQDVIDVNQENFPLQSFHCKSPRKLKTNKIDPSCCVGFYCASKADFENFVESVQLYLHPLRCASGTIERVIPAAQQMPQSHAEASTQNGSNSAELNYPLFTFSRGRCEEHETNVMSDSYYKPAALSAAQLQQSECEDEAQAAYSIQDDDDDDAEIEGETEEFVLL